MLSLQIPQYSHAYNKSKIEKVTILENQRLFEIVGAGSFSANGL